MSELFQSVFRDALQSSGFSGGDGYANIRCITADSISFADFQSGLFFARTDKGYINFEGARKGRIPMKFFEGLKDFFCPPEQDDDYEQQEPVQEQQPQPQPQAIPNEYMDLSEEKRNKVVNIQATAQLQVVLVKPEVFTDAKQIADHLIAKKTVVLNLETASSDNKRRIIDFLVGVAYAIGGSLKPVANLTYIITPYNVGFIGEDLVGELENNGVII